MRRVGAIGRSKAGGWTNRGISPVDVKMQNCLRTLLPLRTELLHTAVNNLTLPPQQPPSSLRERIAEAIRNILSSSDPNQKKGMQELERIARNGHAYGVGWNIDSIRPHLVTSNSPLLQVQYIALLAYLAKNGYSHYLSIVVTDFLNNKSKAVRRQMFYEFHALLKGGTHYKNQNIIVEAVDKALQQESIKIGRCELEVLETLVRQRLASNELILRGAIAAIQSKEYYIGFQLSVKLEKRLPNSLPRTIHDQIFNDENALQQYCSQLLPHLIRAHRTYFGTPL